MGGQSFKCPKCDKWFLAKGALKHHFQSKHEIDGGLNMHKNPYERLGQWYFSDETGDEDGPYKSEMLANVAMLLYGHWLTTDEEYKIVRVIDGKVVEDK
jgi:hypothetical protein